MTIFRRLLALVRRPATAWFFMAVASIVFLVHVVEKGVGRMTSDSPSYLHTALVYEETGEFSFPPYREPGYRAFVWAVSRVLPWNDGKTLARRVTAVQVVVYVALAAALAASVFCQAGIWPAIGVMTIFAMDHYNISWIANVMSEAPAKLLALGALVLVFGGMWRRRPWLILSGVAMCGLLPLVRSTDISVVLAVAAGIGAWALAEARWRSLLTAGLLLVPLFGISAGYSYWYGSQTGFYGVSERGPAHVASRFLTLARPDRLLASGVDPELVESIARPLFERHNKDAGRTDVLQPAGSAYFPTPRGDYLELAAFYLRARKAAVDEREPAILATQLSRQAFLADPAPIIWSVVRIAWDYVRNPLVSNVYGEGAGIQNWVFFGGWFVAAAVFLCRWRVAGPEHWGLFVAAITLMPIYWIGVALGSYYGPRMATHMHLLTTLLFWLSVSKIKPPPLLHATPYGLFNR